MQVLAETSLEIEARNGAGKQLGPEQLMHELGRSPKEPVQAIRDRLCSAVTEFMVEQRGDIALLVARYRAPP